MNNQTLSESQRIIRDSTPVHSVTPLIVTLILLFMASIIGAVVFGIHAVDEQAQHNLKQNILIALDIEKQRQRDILEEYSYWDESYANTIANPDQSFIDNNTGEYILDRYGYAFTASVTGDRSSAVITADAEHASLTLDQLLDHGLGGLADAAISDKEMNYTLSDYLTIDDRIYLVTLGLYVDEDSEVVRPDHALLVFARKLDSDYFSQLGALHQIPGLQIHPDIDTCDPDTLLLNNRMKQPVMALSWQPASPGGSYLPYLLGFVALLSTILAILVMNILRKQQKNQRSYDSTLEAALLEAQSASETKSNFLATMSHEIRTPMNGVIGMAHVLRETPLTDEQSQCLQVINDSGESLLNIINDILDFSKIEAGQIELEEIDFDLEQIAQSVLDLISTQARQKGIEYRLDIAPACQGIYRSDPGRIRQILLNLLNNAVKFTQQGRITLSITTGDADSNPRNIHFAVVDTGMGIAAEDSGRLFQSFSQVDKGIARKYGGTGLGLAISKSLVDLLGGSIGVESKLGEGSTFWFELPLTFISSYQPQQPSATEEMTLYHPPMKILLVEDVVANQLIARKMLDKLGHGVDTVANGFEAIEALNLRHYDLVFMDIRMPELNGLETTRIIRKSDDESISRIPIFAMTANATQQDRQECLDAGMNDYISKPLSMDRLKTVLNQFFSRQLQ